MKNNVLAIGMGFWGRGSSVEEAAVKIVEAGLGKSEPCVFIVANCEVEFVNMFNCSFSKSPEDWLFNFDFRVAKVSAVLPRKK